MNRCKKMDHPACDLRLFQKLKNILKGERFADIQQNATRFLNGILTNEFRYFFNGKKMTWYRHPARAEGLGKCIYTRVIIIYN